MQGTAKLGRRAAQMGGNMSKVHKIPTKYHFLTEYLYFSFKLNMEATK